MRFLIGIFTGAVVTLLVATAMDAPTHPILNNAKDLAAAGWDRLIHATSSSLFEPAEEASADTVNADSAPTGEAAPANEAGRLPAAGESTVQEAADSIEVREDLSDEQAAYAALEPTPALPAPEPIAEPPPSEFWLESALALDQRNNADQPVWIPFHSQMSAEGFAARLSRALGHEFRVVRQGAGAYQVVFDAADADQRALIIAQVTEITGQ